MKSLILFSFLTPWLCLLAAASWVDFWISLAPAITMVLFAIAGWIKLVGVGKKIDAVVSDVATVKIQTNSMHTEIVEVKEAKAKLVGRDEEREKVAAIEAEKIKVEAKVAEGIKAAMAENPPTSAAGSAIEKNVEVVKRDVKVIKEDTGEIKTQVIQEVKAGVEQVVKNSKGQEP